MKPLLSICMMVKNEEKNLRRCLESLQAVREVVASELIIVDTGSEDDTVAIAQQYTDKVFFHAWNNHFADMRNISIGYATGQWILIVDADEQLTQLGALAEFFNVKHPAKLAAGMLTVKNYTGGGAYTILSSLRLFRNDGYFHYYGTVHNEPKFKGAVFVVADAQLDHYGYLSDDSQLMEQKFQRTSKLLLAELENNPDNIYYRFQLAVSYGMHNEWFEGLGEIQAAYRTVKQNGLNIKDYLYIYVHFVQACLQTKNYQKAEMICREGLQLEPELLDLWYYLAQAQGILKKNVDSIASMEQYLSLLERFSTLKISSNPFINHYTICKQQEAYYNLAVLYWKEEEHTKAWPLLETIIDSCDHLSINHLRLLADLAFKTNSFEKLKIVYERLKDTQQDQVCKLVGYIESHLCAQSTCYQKFVVLFADTRDAYGQLNALRRDFIEQVDMKGSLEAYLDSSDLNKLSDWCGDVLYYSICCGLDKKAFGKLSDESSVRYLQYLDTKYRQELLAVIKNKLYWQADCFFAIKTNKVLLKYLLFSGQLNESQYVQYFKNYMDNGIKYVRSLYGRQVFTEQLIYDVKSVEDAFFLYVSNAQEHCGQQKQYVAYLRQAAAVYPEMKQGIQTLLQEMLAATDEQMDEMTRLKQALLREIRLLVEDNNFDSARQVIAEAEGVLGIDMELLAIKSCVEANYH